MTEPGQAATPSHDDTHQLEDARWSPSRERLERIAIGATAVLTFLAAWEAVSRSGWVNPLFISSPSSIARATAALWATGELTRHVTVSGLEFLLGYTLAAAAGIPVGLAAGWYRRLRFAIEPFLSALYATPRVALVPLVILWLGLGLWSKAALVFLGAFFPICLTTLAGVQSVSHQHIMVARSFRATDPQIFRTVVLPSAVPFVLAGLRLGVGRALVGVVVAELYAATAGIGYLITIAGTTFQTDRLFVGIMVLAAFGVFFDVVLSQAERRVQRWRPDVHGRQ